MNPFEKIATKVPLHTKFGVVIPLAKVAHMLGWPTSRHHASRHYNTMAPPHCINSPQKEGRIAFAIHSLQEKQLKSEVVMHNEPKMKIHVLSSHGLNVF
jgi:hypothetical protein